MKKTIIFLSLLLALTSCTNDIKKDEEAKGETKNVEKTKKTEETKTGEKVEDIKTDAVDMNNGNKTYIGFLGTFCPYCKKEMPILDAFYSENKGKMNMLLIITDDKKFKGYTVPQTKQKDIKEMTYEKITGEKCAYVPSYIIYDENKKIIDKKCGGALNKEALEKILLKKEEKVKEVKKEEVVKEEIKEETATGTVEKTNSGTVETGEAKKEVSKEETKTNNLDTKIDKNMVTKKGSKVKVNYIGKTKDDGKEFDNSYTRGATLDFEVQAGQMIKGFDDGVIGMKAGEKKTIEIAPKDGYGEINPDAKQIVPKEKLADFEKNGIKLEVGSELPTAMGKFKIIEVDDKNVTIDTNHALAGKTLIFEVEMVEVK